MNRSKQGWQIGWMPEAIDDMEDLSDEVAQRVREKLEWMQKNFDVVVPEPLHGEWKGFFRLRVGDWRVIYTVDRQKRLIIVHAVGHRSSIYKRRR
ncbi:mRNA interferase RelE/StbE [Candidatus Fervidibacteria bacterium JGI MDM2 JNZ-1-D12]